MTIVISTSRAADLAANEEQNNPFVAFDNIAIGATLGGTSTLADGARANAVTGSTFDYWLPDVPGSGVATFEIQVSSQTVSFVGIEAHNFSDYDATVRVQHSSDGASWADAGVGAVTPSDNRAIAFRMAAAGADYPYWRLRISDLTANDPIYAGVIFFGSELVFPRRFYQGFAPIITPTDVRIVNNISDGGQFVGSSFVANGSSLEASVNHVSPSFVRSGQFKRFMRHYNKAKPFFFGWRPDKYAGDLHYCWRNGNALRPVNSGPAEFMSFDLSASVYEANDE